MKRLHQVVGPVATNVYILADEASAEAIAIDTATARHPARGDPRRFGYALADRMVTLAAKPTKRDDAKQAAAVAAEKRTKAAKAQARRQAGRAEQSTTA